MTKRIGILNSGGDCAGLNTVIDAVVKGLDDEFEIIGFYRGYEGLLENNYVQLDRAYTSQHRWIGGTILKSTNHGNFPSRRSTEPFDSQEIENITKAYDNYQALGLEGLIILGGDGTLFTAYRLQEFGFKIIGIPKSIDNDLASTDFTFGFHTAVEIANNAIDNLHTTAASHDRIMVLEVMGRTAGWISLYAGIAGGANIILIPEIPFSFESIIKFLDFRSAQLNKSTIIIVSEAALSQGGYQKFTTMDSYSGNEVHFGGIGEEISRYINNNSGYEARSVALGHLQRGGSPIAFDKILSTEFGAFGAQLIKQGQYGKMAAHINNQIVAVDLGEAVLSLKLVNPEGQLVKLAKSIGISFGE